ncbi:MAG TPA: MMPL family transporter, partial [Planctomycetaceae bacterium]|nr:MMPL family transporter [Planctomycetaceae bacterium]
MPGQATEGDQHGFLPTILATVTRLALRFPVLTLAFCLGLSGACVVYTQRDLQFKTSRGDLIDPKTDYHQRWLNYTKEFGDVTEDMVVVVEGRNSADIQQVLDDLGPRVEQESRLFKNVLYKVDLSHLRSKALQYSSPEQLQSILGQLDEFSPLLRQFQLLTLRGFFRELRHGLERMRGQPDEIAAQFAEPLLQQMGLLVASLDQFASRERDFESPWHALAQGDMGELGTIFRDRYLLNEKGTMGFLKVQPTAHSSDFNGTSPAISRLRQLIDEAGRRHPEVKLGLTGIPVLESDEMRDSQTAMFYASVISFVGVAILMFWGFQGFRYPLVGTAVLLVGMAWSFGFTTLAIGHLNILSVSFAAMLIGIGIDYSTVYLLRYLELRHEGLATAEALLKTATSAGAGIWTAAISSALAFFCAMLTDFAGVAELGVIAGGGILICTVAAFVVIPAILSLIDRNHEGFRLPRPMESRGLRLLIARYPVALIVLC